MADKSVSELIVAQSVTPTDLFVLEQNGTAKKLTGQILENWLVSFADGHGGIQSIAKLSTSGLADTYRIMLADTTTFDFVVTNGRGVSSLRKTGTSGLVDTYTFTYNDGTTGTFTVTNGEKGDKGDNQYVWIKYASQEPTAESHSFGDVADDWIGIYSGESATAPTDWQQYEWFQIKGEKGDPGVPATLVSSVTDYQTSDSGTVIPSGAWLSSVPVVAQGRYLWTRTTNTFNTGTPAVSYSVSRMGIDGTGSVSSVANISPDADGNIPLTASDVGALSTNGGDLTGELRMNGQPISGLNVPNANDQAANMGFVNQQVKKAAPRNLLDNSDFTNPVNQRGQTSYSGAKQYTIDRWRASGVELTVTVQNGYISLTNGASSGRVSFEQMLEGSYTGKTLTVAVYDMDTNKVYCASATVPSVSTNTQYFGVADFNGHTARMYLSSAGVLGCHIMIANGATANIKWIALYEGEYTAETLPEYQPKGYAAELAECRRYYQRVGQLLSTGAAATGFLFNTTSARFVMSISPMRKKDPTVNLVSSASQPSVISNGSVLAQGALTFATNAYKDAQHLVIVVTVSGGTQYANAVLVSDKDCYFEISADL